LRINIVSASAKAIEHIADAVGDGTDDAAGDAVDDAFDVGGEVGAGEDVASSRKNVLNVACKIAGLVVEEASEGLEESAADEVMPARAAVMRVAKWTILKLWMDERWYTIDIRLIKESLQPVSEEICSATESVVMDRRASRAPEPPALFGIALAEKIRVLLDWVNALWVVRVVRRTSPADQLHVLGYTHMLTPNLEPTTHNLLNTSRTDTVTLNRSKDCHHMGTTTTTIIMHTGAAVLLPETLKGTNGRTYRIPIAVAYLAQALRNSNHQDHGYTYAKTMYWIQSSTCGSTAEELGVSVKQPILPFGFCWLPDAGDIASKDNLYGFRVASWGRRKQLDVASHLVSMPLMCSGRDDRPSAHRREESCWTWFGSRFRTMAMPAYGDRWSGSAVLEYVKMHIPDALPWPCRRYDKQLLPFPISSGLFCLLLSFLGDHFQHDEKSRQRGQLEVQRLRERKEQQRRCASQEAELANRSNRRSRGDRRCGRLLTLEVSQREEEESFGTFARQACDLVFECRDAIVAFSRQLISCWFWQFKGRERRRVREETLVLHSLVFLLKPLSLSRIILRRVSNVRRVAVGTTCFCTRYAVQEECVCRKREGGCEPKGTRGSESVCACPFPVVSSTHPPARFFSLSACSLLSWNEGGQRAVPCGG
ncbi:hypothetical protein KCU90_g33, partial [Aureobasidium melanogenum]